MKKKRNKLAFSMIIYIMLLLLFASIVGTTFKEKPIEKDNGVKIVHYTTFNDIILNYYVNKKYKHFKLDVMLFSENENFDKIVQENKDLILHDVLINFDNSYINTESEIQSNFFKNELKEVIKNALINKVNLKDIVITKITIK